MKYLRFAFVAFVSTLGLAHAQDDEQRRAPPVEIPDFSNLDEYIYEPKSVLTIGMRFLSSAKVAFRGGTGQIASVNAPGEATGEDVVRIYHDGIVQAGSRRQVLDADGNPAKDDAGNPITERVPPAGRTDVWNYTDLLQRQTEGFVAFHDYSADINDTTVRKEESGSNMGLDIAMHRDMGKFFGGRIPWAITVGMSINDVSAGTTGTVRATVNTLTDLYRFYPQPGATLPDPPYSAPSSITEPVLDENGVQIVTLGVPETRTIDTTVMLDSEPQRSPTTGINETSVTNRWKLKGAFYTFRAGPTVWIPITTRLKASVSVGAALIYSGTTYTVTETLTPEIGSEISETEFSEDYKLLPGYYADATLQFDLTERTGFYAGAVYQSAGNYDQKVENATTSYSTKVDFKNLNGVRAGMTIRF